MGQTDAIGKPAPSEYAPAYGGYIDLVPEAGPMVPTICERELMVSLYLSLQDARILLHVPVAAALPP